MRKWIVLFCILCSGGILQAADDAEAVLYGKLVLPADVGTHKRAFRATLYRSRQAPASRKGGQREKKEQASAEHAIISAHPKSFQVEVKPLAEPVEIEQVEVSFGPRVTPVTVGTTVEFINHDEIYHNVFSLTPGARFNLGRHPTGDIVAEEVGVVGKVDLFCDIHPQMHGVILSLDTPYFTRAKADGSYRLEGLPPGVYELRVFHPDVQPALIEVELQPGQEQVRDFNLVK
ncbi:MAG: plastocyanin [Candidatus Latescibacterota bacterium]|jgi:plastocyanin